MLLFGPVPRGTLFVAEAVRQPPDTCSCPRSGTAKLSGPEELLHPFPRPSLMREGSSASQCACRMTTPTQALRFVITSSFHLWIKICQILLSS